MVASRDIKFVPSFITIS